MAPDTSAVPSPGQSIPGARPIASRPNIFRNTEGLRAGWRLLLYLLLTVGFFMGFKILLMQIWKSHPGSFSDQFLAEVIGFASAFGAALLMSLLEHDPVGVYGLPLPGAFGKLFWQGCLIGLLEISLLIGLIYLFGGYSFGSLALHGAEIVRWAMLWALCMIFVGLFEEFLFRGYSFYTLTSGIGFWPAAIVLSLLFGAVHWQNSGEGLLGIAAVVVVGLLLCFTVRRTGSLWFAVGLHAAYDFGETFLYSVPDSGITFPGHLSNATLRGPVWLTGGTVGPEASLFDFLIFILLFYAVHRLYPAGKTPNLNDTALQRTSSDANTNLTP